MPSPHESPLDILVVDDERSSREAICLAVEALGHRCHAVSGTAEAIRAVDEQLYDLALVDLRLGPDSGLELVERFVEESPWVKVSVVTSHASIESAVEAIRLGAVDYVEKPVSPNKLEALFRQVSTMRDLERGIEQLREDLERTVPPPSLTTRSKAVREVYALARRAAGSDATVLIRGESGTGKGVLSRAIHDWSGRRNKPFAVVNTPTLPSELLESELFGHVKGAFTGAVRSRRGRIGQTDGGTLLLDEIGTMPPELQPKILRFLQDRSYEAVGGDKTHVADVRLIVATNHDLEAAVRDGEFREDLYYRIRVIELRVPPLRERPEDIVPLAEGFAAFFGSRHGRPRARLTDAAKRTLAARAWPGNVRELQNAVERAVILSASDRIGARAFPPAGGLPSGEVGGTPMVTLEEAERRHIEGVLEATGSAKAAAEVLGISTTTLWRRRQKHDL